MASLVCDRASLPAAQLNPSDSPLPPPPPPTPPQDFPSSSSCSHHHSSVKPAGCFSITMVTLRSQRETGRPILPDPASLEFCKFMSYGLSWEKLVLPDKFGSELMRRDLRKVKLRVAGGGERRAWDVRVVLDKYGDVYLAGGWRKFARANGLDLGQLLVFRYDGVALITVTVLEGRPCQQEEAEEEGEEKEAEAEAEEEAEQEVEEEEEEDEEDEESNGTEGNSSSPPPAAPSPMSSGSSVGGAAAADACTDDPASSLFTVTLRKCHFGKKQQQYLHVPIWFNEAYRYAERTKVVLQMRGKSWTVSLKHSRLGGGTRAAFRYGWHQFCVDNDLAIGDTCFFRALPEDGAASRGADHVLRVQVRRQDGTDA